MSAKAPIAILFRQKKVFKRCRVDLKLSYFQAAMLVTSNTLFHFTVSLENLIGILDKKFQLTYCHEKYQLQTKLTEAYYPMVSFCDLPLTLAKKHIDSYGRYAIGLNKDWGIKNKLNPVVYVEANSLLAHDLAETMINLESIFNLVKKQSAEAFQEEIADLSGVLSLIISGLKGIKRAAATISKLNKIMDEVLKIQNNHSNLFRYIKNYQGDLIRQNGAIHGYRFYDEREWRFIPEFNDKRVQPVLNEEEYKKYRGNGKKAFISGITLPFNAEDVKYLIVADNNDIPVLMEAIRKNGFGTKSPWEADLLTTKITTVQQLNDDF